MNTLNDPDGLVNLHNFTNQLAKGSLRSDKAIPIVLVPGFSGWGTPLFGAINYWGGMECMPKVLIDEGYTVIVTPIGPLSTNWERACELYRLLTFGQFSCFDDSNNNTTDHFDVDVSYGKYFDSDPENGPYASTATGRRRAILFSKSPKSYENWKWSEKNKVHFICHSQGGNTARYLISLMNHGSEFHPEYFSIRGRDNWVVSMTTLGTPHRGTTVVDVLRNLVPRLDDQVKLLADFFATMAFQDSKDRTYDLQLDHWGISRQENESFQQMRRRFEMDSGPVGKWLNSQNNGFYDNSIEGVNKLNLSADTTSENIYYFSLSFHAIAPFPNEWPKWTVSALNEFPIPQITFIRTIAESIPLLNLGSRFFNYMFGDLLTKVEWAVLSSCVSVHGLTAWLTHSVANNFLRAAGFNIKLPAPGKYIPRTDVIPPMLPTCYAMCGLGLTNAQRLILGPNLGDWHKNDGIVNTESMRGPTDDVVRDIGAFPLSNINSADARGLYWHFGTNDKMDHADEIGIFIDEGTSLETKNMYLNLAQLVSYLPSSTPSFAPVMNGTANKSMNGAAH